MKKLFLTSGIIACMACPAFADPGFGNVSGTQADACDYSHLTAYQGSTTLTAQWQKNWYQITLNEDDVDATTNPNGAGNGTAQVRPDPLYSIYHDNQVYTSHNGTADNNYATWELTSPISAYDANAQSNTVLLTDLPTGKNVNYDLHANSSGLTGTVNMPTSTEANRAFLGFYNTSGGSDVSSATQYVDAQGYLMSAGATAAYGAQADQDWYARYDCATPTWTGGDENHNPTLAGYTFAGWWTGDGTSGDWGTQVTPGCIEQNTDLYAKWTARQFTISYDCGEAPDNSSVSYAAGTTPESATIDMDANYTLANNTCTMPGYTFAGWSCPNLPGSPTLPATGTATYFAEGATARYNYVGDVTCTAQWTPNTISLTWTDPSGINGTNGSQTGECSYDDSISVPSVSRTGYVLTGWTVTSTNPSGQTQQPAQEQP